MSIITKLSPWTPKKLSGCALFLDASMGVTTVDNKCSQWSDQSGNARHASQGTANYRPLLVQGGLNGRPVLRFDGTDDWLALPTDSFDWAIGGNLSVFIAYNITDMSATRRMLTYWYNLGSILVEIGSTDKRQWLYCAGVGACSATNNDGYGSPKVLAGVFSDTANTIRVWNCGAAGTQITNNNSISFHADDRPTIGASRNSSNTIVVPMKGDIAAVIIYNRALSDAERQRVERWLATRYGITLA